MSKSNEIKLAEQLINLTEDHWFNPAIMARYMANQPYYTLDRLMELVAQVIKEVSLRHGNNDYDGVESEGTYLANELNEDFEGGELRFTDSGHTYAPKGNSMVMFEPTDEHEIMEIKSGYRYSCPFWLTFDKDKSIL